MDGFSTETANRDALVKECLRLQALLAEQKESFRVVKMFALEKVLLLNELKLNEKEWADLQKKNVARLQELEDQRKKDLAREKPDIPKPRQ